MIRLAFRNLVQNKTRLLISVGGLALALTLVLFFDAVFTGAMVRLTLYIDRAGADVWVSQQGVQTMHMSSSALPAPVIDQVKAVPGVQEAMPVLYATDMIQAKGNAYVAYVFGLPRNASFGRPWGITEGTAMPGPGEVIIDHAIAASAGLRVGDRVGVLGREMTIAGLTSGTSSLMNSLAFVTFDDFAEAHGQGKVISFVLVKVKPGESPTAVAARIRQNVPGVTVQTRQQFAHEERKLVKDMSADIINIMNTAGFLTGLAVVALTVYIATIARRREYGVLKAIGTRNRSLYSIVLVQAFLSVAMGLLAGILLTSVLAEVIPQFSEKLVLSISRASLLRVTVVSIFLAGIAALLPARQIAGLEPVTITRRG
jgi:putative ABC transport system permease protein